MVFMDENRKKLLYDDLSNGFPLFTDGVTFIWQEYKTRCLSPILIHIHIWTKQYVSQLRIVSFFLRVDQWSW